jgi:predicted flap endonuclease-1-like 5' DNA nuclease
MAALPKGRGDVSNYSIATIEGIGPAYAQKLKAKGVRTTSTLLARGRDARGRKELAAAVGIDESLILKWANLADLMRIKGVGEEYSELLEAAGVDTVKALRNRNVGNLTRALTEANAKRRMVRLLPSEKAVARWVAEAKTLPPVLTY